MSSLSAFFPPDCLGDLQMNQGNDKWQQKIGTNECLHTKEEQPLPMKNNINNNVSYWQKDFLG